MFPKLPDAEVPFNGAEVANEKNRARINCQELFGNDIYATLARRREQARTKLLKSDIAQAEAERAFCIAKTKSKNVPATAADGGRSGK